MKAFLKVGKEVSFPLDLPNYLPVLKRDETIVTTAQSSIELPLDQLKHSLFWFMTVTPLDDIAFNHLLGGNIQQAKEIWHKKECVSSLLNLMACAMIENDITSFAINADLLFQNYASDLCASINETLKLSSDQLIELLVNILNDDGSIDLSSLARVPGTSSSWQKAFGASTVKPLIDEISSAINEAKNVKGASANYNSCVKLMNSTKGTLTQLRGLLGTSDMQYQMIADKLAQTILQCGINYFNDSNDDDAPQKAMTLQKYALSIAVGPLAKERCKENVDILQKIGPEYKVQREMGRIADRLKKFNSKSSRSVDIFASLSGSHSLSEIELFVNGNVSDLQTIKSKLGYTNDLYLKISSAVASAAINALVDKINKAQTMAQITSDKSSLRTDVSSAISIMSKISSLDMTSQCRSYFNNNNSTLNSINSQLNPSGGCYIATMAYGDYNHPQVMVLRDFRDSFLSKRDWGKRFIAYYYAHSPNWVEQLKDYKTINAVIRKGLDAFILLWKNISHHE
ncbi:MAG: hypothetical protein NC095_04305 [Muribaculum sp.]|nr:hypothetical protein [Muribaculum sp.]